MSSPTHEKLEADLLALMTSWFVVRAYSSTSDFFFSVFLTWQYRGTTARLKRLEKGRATTYLFPSLWQRMIIVTVASVPPTLRYKIQQMFKQRRSHFCSRHNRVRTSLLRHCRAANLIPCIRPSVTIFVACEMFEKPWEVAQVRIVG